MKYPSYSILIATKNRPEKMRELLGSITKSSLRPKTVVVVSSGKEIHDVISDFNGVLALEYLHSEITGQVNQKKIGISRLKKEIPWVVFLDDDLLLSPDTISRAFDTLFEQEATIDNILGVGLGLTPTARLRKGSLVQNFLGQILRLGGGNPGRVIRSGQGVSYLESTQPLFTQWLNGASMWRVESAYEYISLVPSSKYAACEDLVFSYVQSKKGKLLFAPDARVKFQESEPNNYNLSQVIISAMAWRYFFVKSNPELSKWQLLYSQLGRLAYLVVNDPGNWDAIHAGFWSVKQLFFSVITNKEPNYLIEKIS